MMHAAKQPYIKRSISVPRPQLKGLEFAAAEDGHYNVSRLIQELVEKELKARYGRNWIVEIERPDGEAA